MALHAKQNVMKIVCLLSGGIDSTTLFFRLRKNEHELIPLLVNYGQKAFKKEFEAVQHICEISELSPNIIDISGLSSISSGLTNNNESPIDNPIFPNRNLILLSVAAAFAENQSCQVIAIGLIGDSSFADQTKDFVRDAEVALSHGHSITILAPMIELNKLEVVRLAKENNISLDFTYSCYFGGNEHCGKCLSCIDRKKVFEIEELPESLKK